MTKRQEVIEFLKKKGLVQVDSHSRKYKKMINPDWRGAKGDRAYWIGKNGAVRVGKNPSNSASITDMIHNLMKREQEK